MNFYSTYYKKQANYDQIIEIQKKFDSLDINGDKALNKDELANIFDTQNLTAEEKDLLMLGLDEDDNGFITYLEFSPAYMEFDIDKNAEISGDEYDFAKQKISELKKQNQINTQYAILNDLTSTEAEKETANDNIEKFKVQRGIIYFELDVKRKEILVSGKDTQIQEINTFIQDNILLEFEEAQKLKQIETLEVEKNLILMDKDISVKKLEKENVTLLITNKEIELKYATDENIRSCLSFEIFAHSQELISKEYQLKTSEKTIEQHHNQVKIEEKEKLLNKFFVPEFLKDQARDEILKLRDQQQLTTQMIDMNNKVSILSQARVTLSELNYEYYKTNDPALLQQIQDACQYQQLKQLESTLSAKKVDLIDKQIQLKALMPKSDRPQFAQLRVDLETAIATLQAEIADIEAQL